MVGSRPRAFENVIGLIVRGLTLFALSCPAMAQTDGVGQREPSIRYLAETGAFELGPFAPGFEGTLPADFDLASVFSIRVAADDPERLGMAGSHVWTAEGSLRFAPRFPLVPGLAYEARFLPSAIPESVRDPAWRIATEVLAVPLPERQASAQVTAIYPSADRLPENLLKFYLHFSRSMSRGEAYRNIRLLDDRGEVVELPFLDLPRKRE